MMKRLCKSLFAICWTLFLSLYICCQSALCSGITEENKREVLSKVSLLQVPFVENSGQIKDEKVKYFANTQGGAVIITSDGVITYLPSTNAGQNKAAGLAIKESLIGTSNNKISGKKEGLARVNVFKGADQSQWKRNVVTDGLVSLGEVYRGIELKLKAYGDRVEKLFYVKPYGDLDVIKIKVEGAKGLKISETGGLELAMGIGVVKFAKPVAYQEENGKKVYVDVTYVANGDNYGFKVKDYDRFKELVIVPTVLCTLPGGVADMGAVDMGFDGNGNLYVTGKGAMGLYIAKFDAYLQNLLVITYLDGTGVDEVHAITIDGSGNVYVAGGTGSTDFPIMPGAYDPTHNGSKDAFIAKLDSDLQTLFASTYLGGAADDEATSLEMDGRGNVVVTGTTSSPDFPAVFVASDSNNQGFMRDFRVTFDNKLNSILSAETSEAGSFTSRDPESDKAQSTGGEGAADVPASSGGVTDKSVDPASTTVAKDEATGTTGIKVYKPGQIAGPGWFMGTADPVTPEKAKAYFDVKQNVKQRENATLVKSSTQMGIAAVGTLAATTSSPEITELARALRYDPKLIYDYVHNHIDYVPYFGSLKGASLTSLDGSGNDFDQASLMIALLRASGYTASYVYGTMTIPGSQLANWLGLDQIAGLISALLSSCGIPVSNLQADGTATVSRVWAKATINGTDYLFDPAFKSYTSRSKIDLKTNMGYNRSDLLAAAGGSSGDNYIQNINEASLGNQLKTYSSNLLNAIRSQYPNHEIKDITGGRDIVQTNLTQFASTLPFSPVTTVSWSQDIPAAYMATLRIQHLGIDYTLNAPDLSGKRLTLSYAGGNGNPELRQDGVLIASGTSSYLLKNDLTMTIDHPYAANGGTFMDQTVTYSLEKGRSYAVVYNFGGSSDELMRKRQQQLETYRAQGLAATSEAVLGETLNIMGLTWLKEVAQTESFLSALAETVSVIHHNIGVMAQEGGYYIDVKALYKATASRHDTMADLQAHFKVSMLIGSAFEHGILEQSMGSDKPGVSTIKLLQIANATGCKIFSVNSANFASIKPQLVNYSAAELTSFENLVNNGYDFVLPDNGQLSLGTWKGEGYIKKKFDPTWMSMAMAIGGGYYGGYVANEGAVSDEVLSQVTEENETNNSFNSTSTTVASSSIEPVDMASGAYYYDHTDLALGGTAPLGLVFARSYDSRLNLAKKSLGQGWTHNYDIYLSATSHGDPGLGSRQPVDAASIITTLYACLDLLKTNDDVAAWMAASLASKWGVDQLIDNAVTVHMGKNVVEFIKLADGSYAPPPGITTQLLKNADGTFSIQERFGTRLDFNANKQIAKLTDVDGNVIEFAYGGKNLVTVKDAFSRILQLEYNTEGRLGKVSNYYTRLSVFYGYDANGNLTSYTDPEGKVWGYGYDANHRMTSLTNPLTITTATNAYDSLGRVMTQIVPRQGPAGTTATYNFYFSGFRNVEEDPAGNTLTYYYDEKGREYVQENALGHKIVKAFDGQNHVIRWTDPKSNSTTYLYDGKHNLTKITNALTHEFSAAYDSLFRLIDITAPLSRTTHFDYDAKHHLTLARDAAGNQFQATYYANGLANTVTDGRGTVTTLAYDNYGNPRTAQTGTRPAITYTFDMLGRMTGLTDQVNAATTFAYDKRGLPLSKTDPLLKSTGATYYADGKLWTKTDRNGNTTTYNYTPSGKLENISYPGGSPVSLVYNLLDKPVEMWDGIGVTRYTHDAAGRVTSTTNPFDIAVSYAYDAAGNLTELTYPGNKRVTYAYDELNRLKTVTNWLNQTATYVYDDAGRLSSLTNFNGTVTTYGYDAANRLTDINSAVADYHFTLDANGNRTQITQTEPLAPILTPGNTSYTYNTRKNRLQTAGTSSFGYDNEGRLSSGYGSSYSFDYEHRLTGMGGASFSYDGGGRRLQAVRSGAATRYVYGGGNLLAETDGANTITRYYIYGAGLLAMVTPADEIYCYHYNGTGSTIAMTDQSQAMVNKYAYDPFGKVANQEETVPQPFKYVGQYGVMAEPNGFYYMRARYYDPNVGRFVSEDPIGFGGGDVNLFGYVRQNPINSIDPSGLLAPPYHFAITYQAARDSGYGITDSAKLAWNTMMVDANGSTTGTDISSTRQHGMGGMDSTGQYQSPSEAISTTNDYIAESAADGNLPGALHAAEDLPGHAGESMEGFGFNSGTANHMYNDWFPSKSTLNEAYQGAKNVLGGCK